MANQRILLINGSYRDDGISDQAVDVVAAELRAAGAETDVVILRDYPIEFCLNCRECCQAAGDAPGKCVIDDGMAALIERIEAADAYVLASPVNYGSVTAVFKRFMERLMPYAWWPWDQPYPRERRQARKKALLISSSAAPAWFGRFVFNAPRQLKMTARTIGAIPVGTLFTGLVSDRKDKRLPSAAAERARRLAHRLLTV